MIPKTIHFMWFGGGAHTDLQKRCMESWGRHAPDYEIVRWDESNCDMNENEYARQAYREKKWAFVSDYFRFRVLAKHGGFYLDTDVELHKSLDELRGASAVYGFETRTEVNGAVVGTVAGHPITCAILATFDKDTFANKGRLNAAPIPVRITKTLRENGLKLNGKMQCLTHGTAVYPANVLTIDAKDGLCVAEHHYEFSWNFGNKQEDYKVFVHSEFFKNGLLHDIRRKLKQTVRPFYRLISNRLDKRRRVQSVFF